MSPETTLAKKRMPLRKRLVRFLVGVALIYGLLIAPWPRWDDAYASYFRGLGTLVFVREASQRSTRFEPTPRDGHSVLSTQILIANRDQRRPDGNVLARVLQIDPRGIGWIPTALVIALTLSTPLPFPRRLGALAAGLVLVHAFILFSVATYIWDESTEVGLLALSAFWKRVLDGVVNLLISQLGASFVAPAVIWIFVSFRNLDFETAGEFGRPVNPRIESDTSRPS